MFPAAIICYPSLAFDASTCACQLLPQLLYRRETMNVSLVTPIKSKIMADDSHTVAIEMKSCGSAYLTGDAWQKLPHT